MLTENCNIVKFSEICIILFSSQSPLMTKIIEKIRWLETIPAIHNVMSFFSENGLNTLEQNCLPQSETEEQ
jgi:hypothetical protein